MSDNSWLSHKQKEGVYYHTCVIFEPKEATVWEIKHCKVFSSDTPLRRYKHAIELFRDHNEN